MRCRLLPLIVAAAALVVCGQGLANAQTADDLFNDQVLHRIDVYIHSKDWLLLKANYSLNTHYPADLRWQGKVVRNAAVRSHGRFTRSPIKPSLHFNFDRYASGQTFLGLRALVLKNLGQDPSTLREFLAMKMHRRLGVPAPRVAFAAVYVNNAYGGLYGVVEDVDTVTAQRVFGESSGTLFEYNWLNEWRFQYLGSDLAEYAQRFEPANHLTDTQADLYGPFEAWCRFVNDSSADEFSAGIAQYVDVAALTRHVASQAFMAELDGFTGFFGVNNIYVYRPSGTTVHRLIAWDEDQACNTLEFPITFGHDANSLMRRLMEIPAVRQVYYATLLQAAGFAEETSVEALAEGVGRARSGPARTAASREDPQRYAAGTTVGARVAVTRPRAAGPGTGWLESEALRALNLVRAAVYQDTLKPYTNEEFETAAAFVLEFCRVRSAFVRSEVARMTNALGSGTPVSSR